MKKQFWLCRRGGSFYVFDSETGRRESLRTRDPQEAQRLLAAKIEATEQPRLNMAIARAYLAASDARYTERTWEAVMTEFESRGKPTTRIRCAFRRVTRASPSAAEHIPPMIFTFCSV